MEENKKVFNIVYDNWDENSEMPKPNTENVFGDEFSVYIDSFGIVRHWIVESKKSNKFDIRRCRLSDIDKDPNQNYYYMVGHYTRLMRDFVKGKSPLNEIVLEYLKKYENFKVIFHSEHECDEIHGYFELIKYIKRIGIPENKFYWINNNSILESYKQIEYSEINLHSIEFIPSSYVICLEHIGGCEFVKEKTGRFFMSFNRAPKIHRICLLALLTKYKIIDDVNWSYVPESRSGFDIYGLNKIINKNYFGNIDEYLNKILNTTIKRSDFEENMGWFNPHSKINTEGLSHWMRVPELMKNYEESYFNITTESRYEDMYNTIHISEKSFKPFYHYQFPLILASANHIKTMKERYNLDFFDDIIDHSYDNELDEKNRLIRFFQEIQRINENKSFFIKFYQENQLRFEENKQKIKNILLSERDYEYFENLI